MDALLSGAVREVSAARSPAVLVGAFPAVARSALSVDVAGMYLYGESGRPRLAQVSGAPDLFARTYEQHGRAVDPVLRAVVDSHAPVASSELMSMPDWRTCQLYERVSGRFGLEHIMTAPVVSDGRLIGTLNVARRSPHREFKRADVAALGALALHISATLARTTGDLTRTTGDCERLPLTPRELDVAALVAEGLTNFSISRRLGVSSNTVKQALKRIFAKTGVSSRTELAVLLSRTVP